MYLADLINIGPKGTHVGEFRKEGRKDIRTIDYIQSDVKDEGIVPPGLVLMRLINGAAQATGLLRKQHDSARR